MIFYLGFESVVSFKRETGEYEVRSLLKFSFKGLSKTNEFFKNVSVRSQIQFSQNFLHFLRTTHKIIFFELFLFFSHKSK